MDQDTTTILLTCLSYASKTANAEQLAHISSEEWQAVAALARLHGVAPLVYHHLKRLGIALPGELAKELIQAFLGNAARNIRLYHELEKLLRRLQEKDIPVIALKGAYLAEAVYENIGLRSMGDVDLLVKKDDLLRIEQELFALGSGPEETNHIIGRDGYEFHYTLTKSHLRIDLHWMILASCYSFRINVEELWARAQSVRLGQAPAMALSPEDLLLHLCLHIADNTCNMKIRMLCDVGAVVQRYADGLDWQALGGRARQWGITHAVYMILRLTKELLEAAVPGDWLASLEPAGFNEGYIAIARRQILSDRGDGKPALSPTKVTQLWRSRGLGSKIAILRQSLLPSRETLVLMDPALARSWRIYLYYIVRLKDVLIRHGPELWRLVRGNLRVAIESTNPVIELRDWLLSE